MKIKHPVIHGAVVEVQHYGRKYWKSNDSFIAGIRTLKATSLRKLKKEIVLDYRLAKLGLRAYALVAFLEGNRFYNFIIENEKAEFIEVPISLKEDVCFNDLPEELKAEIERMVSALKWVMEFFKAFTYAEHLYYKNYCRHIVFNCNRILEGG
jgi:hypothetical protein